jgi:hypothetical protein
MPFELPSGIPNFNTNIPQMPPALDTYGKMLQLKSLQGEQQLQPLRVEAAQQDVQAKTLENQQAQQKIESQKALIKAWSDPDFSSSVTGTGKDIAPAIGFTPGFDPNKMIKTLVSKGVLPQDAMAQASSFLELSKNLSLKTKDDLSNYKEAHQQLANLIGPITSMKVEDAGPALEAVKQKVASGAIPGLDPRDVQLLQQADLAHLQPMVNLLNLGSQVAEYHKGQAEATRAAGENTKTQLEIAPPTPAQLATFTTKTLPSFAALKPEQKQAFIAEAGTARTVDELNKVIERADSTDKSEQMHRDSLAQTEALKGQTFAQQGLKENDKTWTDPQHGYLQTLAQANLGKKAIVAGADGNGLLTSLEPTMAALGVSSFAGVHRVPPTEAAAAGAPGGWAERFTAWADKSASGKLSPQLAREGTELFDQLIDSKYQASVQASAMHAKGYNIPPANLPVMDREGNLTTLDKAPKTSSAPKTPKILTMSAIQQAATDNKVSVDEAKRQAKAAGYTIQ